MNPSKFLFVLLTFMIALISTGSSTHLSANDPWYGGLPWTQFFQTGSMVFLEKNHKEKSSKK